MKYFSIILLTLLGTLFMSGCSSNSDTTPTTETTEFFQSVSSVINQGEDDEPLSVTDSSDETSSFDSFL